MKKIIITILLAIILTIGFFPTISFAQTSLKDEIANQNRAFSGKEGAGFGAPRDPRVIVANIIKILLTLVGTLFFAYTVYGGALWMMSAGVEEKITKGKDIIRNGIIGVVIILGAYSITWMTYWMVYQGQSDPFGDYEMFYIYPDTDGFYETDPLNGNLTPDALFED